MVFTDMHKFAVPSRLQQRNTPLCKQVAGIKNDEVVLSLGFL